MGHYIYLWAETIGTCGIQIYVESGELESTSMNLLNAKRSEGSSYSQLELPYIQTCVGTNMTSGCVIVHQQKKSI